jgi:alpha-ribazole phosphatase/probable phosphoglycerate mutase
MNPFDPGLLAMNLYMIRHGEIVSNIKKIYAGSSDEGLSRKGIYQAEQAAAKLKNYHVHSLYSSPMRRALETAHIIGEKISKKPVIYKAFREMELGPWEGMSERQVSRDWPREWNIWNKRPAELKLHGRETLHELQVRVLRGVRNIHQQAEDGDCLIITHVAVIRVLLIWRAGDSLNSYRTISVPNADIFRIEIDSSLSLP